MLRVPPFYRPRKVLYMVAGTRQVVPARSSICYIVLGTYAWEDLLYYSADSPSLQKLATPGVFTWCCNLFLVHIEAA
jgi:hypothetical protein